VHIHAANIIAQGKQRIYETEREKNIGWVVEVSE